MAHNQQQPIIGAENLNVPEQVPPMGLVAVLDPEVALAQLRANDQQRNLTLARAAAERFRPQALTLAGPQQPTDEEVQAMIYESAMNIPFPRVIYPQISTYTPCFSSILFYLNYEDMLMASTKRWTDNCMGWVPPVSQIYISILLYFHVLTAMELAGSIRPGSELSALLRKFKKHFRSDNLWIPGPCVQAFKNISAFWPCALGTYGNVTPALPATPGWTRANRYCITDPHHTHLPNINLFISRFRSICAAAQRPNANEATFLNDIDGPRYLATYSGRACDHNADELRVLSSPGAALSYAGNMRLWADAASLLSDLPQALDIEANAEVRNDWTTFLRFDQDSQWFGRIAAIMAKYCQYSKDSCPLSECSPTRSAAGAVRLIATPPTTIFDPPAWTAQAGQHTSHQHGNVNQIAHYTMRQTSQLTCRAYTTVEELPSADINGALTYHLNLAPNAAAQAQLATGPFWNVTPTTYARSGISVYQGVYTTIAHDYHSDVRIESDRQ